MRQRIKAVETIKKITHAMRLTSMSSHSRLRQKKVQLERYKQAFQKLWSRLEDIIVPEHDTAEKAPYKLLILVGTQKGLCGTLNSSLFKFFEEAYPRLTPDYHVVAVGKSAADYCSNHKIPMLASYNEFSASNFVMVAQAITDLMTQPLYNEAVVLSNYQKSFFVQKPRSTTIFPLATPPTLSQETQEEYIFEQSPEELSTTIRHLMLVVHLQELFFEALLAEHAARFLSMDTSTRNADNLLIEMKLAYNKSRQAAITRELTELATSE